MQYVFYHPQIKHREIFLSTVCFETIPICAIQEHMSDMVIKRHMLSMLYINIYIHVCNVKISVILKQVYFIMVDFAVFTCCFYLHFFCKKSKLNDQLLGDFEAFDDRWSGIRFQAGSDDQTGPGSVFGDLLYPQTTSEHLPLQSFYLLRRISSVHC